eukprot:9971689-Alexandrium_andersonii.AAC.1
MVFSHEQHAWESIPTFAASRGGEVTLKGLDSSGREQFAASDLTEWQAILGMGVVRVMTHAESDLARTRHPDR